MVPGAPLRGNASSSLIWGASAAWTVAVSVWRWGMATMVVVVVVHGNDCGGVWCMWLMVMGYGGDDIERGGRGGGGATWETERADILV